MGRLRNIFKNTNSSKGSNWKAIVLSILAASVFWLFQSLNKDYSTNLNYPIEFDFPAEQYVVMDKLPDEVQINISGIGWNIFRKTFSFGLTPIRIHLESPATTAKLVGAALLANINDQLPQFQVNYVISDTLNLNIEPKSSKNFAVYIDSLSIDLKEDFRMTSQIMTDADSVTLSGPKSIIMKLPDSLPLGISEQAIDKDFEEAIKFTIRGYQQSLLEVVPEEIVVQFDVEEFVTVSYKVKLTKVEDLEVDIYSMDSMINVVYSIPRSAQATIDKSEIAVVALPETLNKEDSTIQVSIQNYPEVISEITLDSTSAYLKVIYE